MDNYTNKILLSYVLPVYNVEKYLKKCLESIYNQNLNKELFEVICINDGSTDNSEQIVHEFQKCHCNIILINQDNHGLSYSRNAGIEKARGEYIFFVDSDDYIASDVINNILSVALETKVDMLFFDAKRTHSEDYKCAEYVDTTTNFRILNGRDYFAEYAPGNGSWAFLISNSFLTDNADIRFMVNRYCEDGMFVVFATNRAKHVIYRHSDVYRYVARFNSITTKKDVNHQLKVVEDFVCTIGYINKFVISEKENKDVNERYVNCLIDRRDSYTFFLQVRMMKAKLSKKERQKYLSPLFESGCLPYKGINNRGLKYKLISIVFSCMPLYDIACWLYALLVRE